MSHANQFRDTPHYVPLTGEITAGKIQGEARGFPDASSGTVDWTGNPTTISSPEEMRIDDIRYRQMAVPDGVRKNSNFPRHDSDGLVPDAGVSPTGVQFNNRYNNSYIMLTGGNGQVLAAYAPTSNAFTSGGSASIINEGSQSVSTNIGKYPLNGVSFLDQNYPPFNSSFSSGFSTTQLYPFGSVYRSGYSGPVTGAGHPNLIDSDCSMLYSKFKVTNQQYTYPNQDWNSYRNETSGVQSVNMIKEMSNINASIPTDSAVSADGFHEYLQLLHDRSKSGPFNNISESGTDFAEPPKLKDNRGIGEIRFSDFRGKSQVYKSDYLTGDNHGYGQYGYYGFGHGNWPTLNYFGVASNGMFLSGGTNSAGTALNAFGFVHPDFGGKSSPTGITLPNSGGAIDVFVGAGFSQKSTNDDTDGNLHFHQKHNTQRKTGQTNSSIFLADVANFGRCTHMIWYTDTTFTTADYANQNGQIGANASWPAGTHGTNVANYIFEIGFSSRLRNTLFSKITWANGTQANNTGNNTNYFGQQNAVFYPRSNFSEVAYRGAHADNGYFGQTVWRGLYSCGTSSTYGGPSDVATESRPLPSNTTSTTATGNVQLMQFYMQGTQGIGWREFD